MPERDAGPASDAAARRVIHDLRQPLAALRMWLDLLDEALRGQLDARQERYLGKVRAEASRLGTLLESGARSSVASEPPLGLQTPMQAPMDDGDVREAVAAQVRGELAGRCLLVVEDDDSTAEALQFALESEGARVLLASTIAQGLARYVEGAPDALLSDVHLADGDGCALVAEIRRRERAGGRSTVAIAVTGDDADECRAAARAAGFDEVIVKPYALPVLIAALSRLIASG